MINGTPLPTSRWTGLSLLSIIVIVLNFACVSVPQAHAQFASVDSFGSARVNETVIQSKYGAKIAALGALDENSLEEFFRLKVEIEGAIKQDFGLPYISFDPSPDQHVFGCQSCN